MPNALEHVRVLDLSRILAGPWATQLLGDFGAEIIKIENPTGGDDTRRWGPPFLPEYQGNSDAAYFMCANRNKKSVTINISSSEGQRLIRDLVAKSDVLVENFKVGALARYGLAYESLKDEFPGLIYCSITGFGQTGPYADRAGYDFLIQGMGGLMSITGRADAEEGAGPLKVGVAVVDLLTGLYASNAILAALAHRERTGLGQHIDLALLDVQVACTANQAMNYLYGESIPKRLGNAHPNVVPYQDFPTADGDIIIAVGNDGQFLKLCDALGASSLSADPRYSTNAGRVDNRSSLIPALRSLTAKLTSAELIAKLEAFGVPCGPINDMAHVFADPQVVARQMKIETRHAAAGDIPLVANPAKLSLTPPSYRSAPPLLGQHTHEVLTQVLGVSEAEWLRLKQERVI